MKITLPMTSAKVGTYVLLALYGVAVAALAVLLFDPELAGERTNPPYLVTPFLTGIAATAWLFFLRPLSARLEGTVLVLRGPRLMKRVDLATTTTASMEQPGTTLVLRPEEGPEVRLPLDAATETQRAALASAFDGNEALSAKEAAARLRMPSIA
ncbi:hypothetical protein [Phytomonospora endophytica]|uniref:PH domain-containing protein n=1 Tax=Phytomonospora endophytica TaxID=714109 RepID=A0A841FJA4_9ACTN|nr:hypothetical protein [Phytomonospora endophytica]MBB6036276.1 hypothetical protein [Phytomonospora endophytica]GIG67183.1 hypothetical protein Pen01_34780 [Phytomonospora endophytica]